MPHSLYSPSAASRWLACPGSLDHPAEDSTSVYAAEGTVAHALAQRCWLLGSNPSDSVGSTMSADGFDFEVSEEMADAVQVFLDVCEAKANRPGAQSFSEIRAIHSANADFGGTVDFASHVKGGSIEVVDFKYGAGVVVEVEANAQMSAYALLLLDHLHPGASGDVNLTIVQPRATHDAGPVRSWVASRKYLEDFREQIGEVMQGKRAGQYKAGEHCRWCDHKANCQTLYTLTMESAKAEFDQEGMTPEKASEVMEARKAIKLYLDAVEKWTHGQMDKGVEVPNYKLVNTYGNRRYAVSEDEVVKRCRSRKFGKKQIFKSALLSPAALEKVVGKELIASMVERPHKGTTVVPASDKRDAVQRLDAAAEFSNDEG